MSRTKTILVSCGTAIATSTVVAKAIEEALADRGINVETRQCKAAEIGSRLSGIDLIVSTTPVLDDVGVPVIQTLAFLTGMGREEVIEKIIEAIQS